MLVPPETLFGAAAAFTSLAGIGLAIWSHISTQRSAAAKAARETHDALIAEERLSEHLSKELHDLRLKYGETGEDPPTQ